MLDGILLEPSFASRSHRERIASRPPSAKKRWPILRVKHVLQPLNQPPVMWSAMHPSDASGPEVAWHNPTTNKKRLTVKP